MNKQAWLNVAYFNISEFGQSNNFGFDVSSPEIFFYYLKQLIVY